MESINYCEGSHGDAGIIATAHDYYLFMRGLMEGQIVEQTTLDNMLNTNMGISRYQACVWIWPRRIPRRL